MSKTLESWLSELGQNHILEKLNSATDQQKGRLLEQITKVNETYPGGINAYYSRAKELLENSKLGKNPFEGYIPSTPTGVCLKTGSEQFAAMEKIGHNEIPYLCFTLVAGGLGERLGYPGIKVALPCELTTGRTYLEYYSTFLLAFQEYSRIELGIKDCTLPLAIMTSDDTHDFTIKLLRENSFFGLQESQVHIVKQEKVPALIDGDVKFAISNSFELEMKPHGHGDVHSLLASHGIIEKWHREGKKWVVFFQDTNSLSLRGITAVLGVSVTENMAMNSICVPRKPGEAVGAICRLEKDSESLTLNVEYNQLEPMLKATTGHGDVADEQGLSCYPGNLNTFVLDLNVYYSVMVASGEPVIIPEFVNPKYMDESKTTFKSPARLECMMQEYPRLLPGDKNVGFTALDRWLCFSTVKNNAVDAATKSKAKLPAESAFTAEADFYANSRKLLTLAAQSVGTTIDLGEELPYEYLGIEYTLGSRVVLDPTFAISLEHLKTRIKPNSIITLSSNSTLVIKGNVKLGNLDLDGHLALHGKNKELDAENIKEQNQGWGFEHLDLENIEAHPPHLTMRGYDLVKREQKEITA